MRARAVLLFTGLWVVACADGGDTEDTDWWGDDPSDSEEDTWEAGGVTVDGQTCPFEDSYDDLAYCLEGSSRFASGPGNNNTCDGTYYWATIWLPADALSYEGTYTLGNEETTYEPYTGTLWLDEGDNDWESTSGTAELSVSGDVVRIEFQAELEEFIDGSPGPSASGTVYCLRPPS